MKIEDLKLSENAVLAIDLLRKLIQKIEKPDMVYDESVEELVMLLDIAAHTSSHDIVQCAQQFLGFVDYAQIMFFKTVGVSLENIFAAKLMAEVQRELEHDVFNEGGNTGAPRYKYM